jgi:hypothetical protein
MSTPKELETFYPLHCGFIDVDGEGGALSSVFLKSKVSSFILLTLRERLISCHPSARAFTSPLIGYIIVVGNQAYHCCVITMVSKAEL